MPNYLLLTPGGFYLRLRVPVDLRIVLGKREIKKPLHTHDRKTASRLANLLVYNIEQQFNKLREPFMANTSSFPNFHGMVLKRKSGSELDMTVEEFNAMSDARARLLLDGDYARPHVVSEDVPSLIPASSVINEPFPLLELLPQHSSTPVKQIFTLKKSIEKYKKEKSRGWAPGTALCWDTFTKLLLEYFGDVRMSSITRDAANEFIDVLSYAPPARHKPKYLGRSLKELSQVNKKLDTQLKKAKKTAEAAGEELDLDEYDGELPDRLDTATINGH